MTTRSRPKRFGRLPRPNVWGRTGRVVLVLINLVLWGVVVYLLAR